MPCDKPPILSEGLRNILTTPLVYNDSELPNEPLLHVEFFTKIDRNNWTGVESLVEFSSVSLRSGRRRFVLIKFEGVKYPKEEARSYALAVNAFMPSLKILESSYHEQLVSQWKEEGKEYAK